MKKYHIPTAAYENFEDAAAAMAYLETAKFPIVLKADGRLFCKSNQFIKFHGPNRHTFRNLPDSGIARGTIDFLYLAAFCSFCGTGYYGIKVHEKALERGVKVTGATVHFVDEGTDTGPAARSRAYAVLLLLMTRIISALVIVLFEIPSIIACKFVPPPETLSRECCQRVCVP